MIPYLGCKQSIAKELLACIPEAEHFYDLFGGGGSVSEAAAQCRSGGIFGEWRKWKNIHYNEINKGVCLLNKEIWAGEFDFEKAKRTWIGRERFFAEKDEPTAWGAMVRFCWSFGNDGDSYIYGEKLELAKQLLHALVVSENPWFPNSSMKERRLHLRKAIKTLAKSRIGELESLERLERLERLQSLQSLERLQSLQSLERLERLQSLQSLESLERLERLESLQTTCLDYRDARIEPHSVVYCDIPYDTGADDYGVKFDHAAFLDWAATRPFPVYFSEYGCTDGRFRLAWSKEVLCRRSKKEGKGVRRTERLFWNGVEL